MKLFVIGSDVPFQHHGEEGVTAVNIVSYQILKSLKLMSHDITLQIIFNRVHPDGSLSAAESQELQRLTEDGFTVLPPIYAGSYLNKRPVSAIETIGKRLRILTCHGRVSDHYPATRVGPLARERIRASGCDAILTLWSPEGTAATYGFRDIPKVSYQADPDYHPVEVRLKDHELFSGTTGYLPTADNLSARVRLILHRWWLAGFKKAHLRMMRDVDAIATIAAGNANFYRTQGHPRSIYARNTWFDPAQNGTGLGTSNPHSQGDRRTVKIIGHAGNLNATGTTYGLKFLLVDLLPILEKIMDGIDYRIHIIGGGQIAPVLQPRLQHPKIIVRGFVKNLDSELRSSDIFLLLNNAGTYKAAFTRMIMAWSMGLCLIAHGNSHEAIPEVAPAQNVLVGNTPLEVAQQIRLAATDPAVNQRIRREGRTTYEKYFAPQIVARTLHEELVRLAGAG